MTFDAPIIELIQDAKAVVVAGMLGVADGFFGQGTVVISLRQLVDTWLNTIIIVVF